jgi:hypothetical protein
MELVDDAFDKFVGQAGGRGKRGREVLPEEIKVRERITAFCVEILRRIQDG